MHIGRATEETNRRGQLTSRGIEYSYVERWTRREESSDQGLLVLVRACSTEFERSGRRDNSHLGEITGTWFFSFVRRRRPRPRQQRRPRRRPRLRVTSWGPNSSPAQPSPARPRRRRTLGLLPGMHCCPRWRQMGWGRFLFFFLFFFDTRGLG